MNLLSLLVPGVGMGGGAAPDATPGLQITPSANRPHVTPSYSRLHITPPSQPEITPQSQN